MIVAGIVVAVAGLVMAPSIWVFAIILAAALLPGIIATIYSIRLARR